MMFGLSVRILGLSVRKLGLIVRLLGLSGISGGSSASSFSCRTDSRFTNTVTGFEGDTPFNFNYVVEPGEVKQGVRSGTESPYHGIAPNPFLRTAEFCGTCHKVHLPRELNGYRWLRGQNHYDSFLLSGVSGHGVRSFYYPDAAQSTCNGCHMPTMASDDFGARRLDDVAGEFERRICGFSCFFHRVSLDQPQLSSTGVSCR